MSGSWTQQPSSLCGAWKTCPLKGDGHLHFVRIGVCLLQVTLLIGHGTFLSALLSDGTMDLLSPGEVKIGRARGAFSGVLECDMLSGRKKNSAKCICHKEMNLSKHLISA